MEKIYLSKPEIDDLNKAPYELMSRTIEQLTEHGAWTLSAVYNQLRAMSHQTAENAEIVQVDDEIIQCSCCPKLLWFSDTWSPGDEVLCSECNKEVTGRWQGPTVDPSKAPPP
jgi:hypothetical protein